jgi:hypothetical protein
VRVEGLDDGRGQVETGMPGSITHKSKLRIALLIDGWDLPAWAYRMVEIIQQSDYAEVILVIRNTIPGDRQDTAHSSSVAVRLLIALQRALVGRPGLMPDASREISATEALDGIDVIEVTAKRVQDSDYLEADELARISHRKLDVLISLSRLDPRGGILGSARHGVWTCQFGDNKLNDGVHAGYGEVMESRPETISMARMLTEKNPDGFVLWRSFSSTNALSLADNQSNVQWKSLHFIPRKLKELHQTGEPQFLARLEEDDASLQFDDRPLPRPPTNRELGALLWRKLVQKWRRKWGSTLFRRRWILLYDIGDRLSTSLCRFKPLAPPGDGFWADPFIVSRDGTYHIFVEEGSCLGGKGHISVIVMNKDGRCDPPVRVVEAPYHLSYPFVFEFKGALYMIPESYDNRTVEMYKCAQFPYRWEFHKTLMVNCRAADTTLLEWQGRWWMFSSRTESDGPMPMDELFLHYSDSPLSDRWTPHPCNPVVSDVRSARPAGRLFVRNGRLYRPSQDCSRHYGYAFNICEITKLTESAYEEKILTKVKPNWDPKIISTHTLSYEDGLTVIDGELLERKGWWAKAHGYSQDSA